MTPNEDDARDAARYRKLCRLLEYAYEKDSFASEQLDVYCQMASAWGKERTMQAELRWTDKRDEPLDLGPAIDAAYEELPR